LDVSVFSLSLQRLKVDFGLKSLFHGLRQHSNSGLSFQQDMGIDQFDTTVAEVTLTNYSKLPIFYHPTKGTQRPSPLPGPYLPTWQTSPILKSQRMNLDLLQDEYSSIIQGAIDTGTAVFGPYEVGSPGYLNSTNQTTAWIATLRSMEENATVEYLGAPVTRLFLPIFDTFGVNSSVVGMMMNVIHWRSYFFDILPDNIRGLVVVMENTCYGYVTFDVSGPEAITRGLYDGHDHKYSIFQRTISWDKTVKIASGTKNGLALDLKGCLYNVHVYPSQVGLKPCLE
jgi:hypothetical protein